MISSGTPVILPNVFVKGALGLVSNACGTRCVEAGPGFPDLVTCRLRWASLSQLPVVVVVELENGIGALSYAICATRQW